MKILKYLYYAIVLSILVPTVFLIIGSLLAWKDPIIMLNEEWMSLFMRFLVFGCWIVAYPLSFDDDRNVFKFEKFQEDESTN